MDWNHTAEDVSMIKNVVHTMQCYMIHFIKPNWTLIYIYIYIILLFCICINLY